MAKATLGNHGLARVPFGLCIALDAFMVATIPV